MGNTAADLLKSLPLDALPHGYTNETRRSGAEVKKRFMGVDAETRCKVERLCLQAFKDGLPVPNLLGDVSASELTMEFVQGSHGQELIEAGEAPLVLHLTGELLAKLQRIPVDAITGIQGDGVVLVHGDFGPQNLLVDSTTRLVTALLDWEFAHIGDPVEDLAWAEWIVRMHHPDQAGHISGLFEGYGGRPAWQDRQTQMVRRCEQLIRFSQQQGWTDAEQLWEERTRLTQGWTE